MIPRETVDKIIEASRIDEVVGEFVSLKKRGANLIGNCPFHDEKTPSFSVSPVKGIYKCFGCGKAGNAVNFIMEHEKLTYPEALRVLAKKYQIEIEEKKLTQDQVDAQNVRESLFLANAFAQKQYADILWNTEVGQSVGYSYFVERGFSDEIIQKFQLGYATEDWAGFTDEALKQGYNKDMLVKAGLTMEKGDRAYDRFRSRVIFPIHTLSGRVVAFTARTLSADKKIPKYVNSPETEIYHKRNVLYGLYFAKKAIVDKDNCFLVEGNTDVLSLFQAGIENVVASSGTALTSDQIRLIRRYTKNITILYDGDAAGIKASFRGIDLILEEGMNVKVVLFPDGEDPDSYARNHSATEIAAFISANATDFIHYKTSVLKEEAQGDPIKKSGMIKDIVSSIALIPDPITASLYIKQCCELMEVSEQMLASEVAKMQRQKLDSDQKKERYAVNFQEAAPQEPAKGTGVTASSNANDIQYRGKTYYQEMDVIRLMLQYGQTLITVDIPDEEGNAQAVEMPVAQVIVMDLQDSSMFSDQVFKLIFEAYLSALEREEVLPEQYFVHHQNDMISKAAINILHSNFEMSTKWEEKHKIICSLESNNQFVLKKSVQEAVLKLRSKYIQQNMVEVSDALKSASSEQEQLELMQQLQELMNFRNQIENMYGRVVS